MSIKVAINGFGRIGRLAFRLMMESDEVEVVAINDLTDAETLAYLLKYDTAQGPYKTDNITGKDGKLIVEGKEFQILAQRNPEDLPWGDLGIDVVLECTGFFTSKEGAEKHLTAGAKKVLISAPAKGDLKTIVYNVNHDILDGSETVVSGASCTTNCLAPVAKVLDDNFGLVKGFMTTIHAYTNDQAVLDRPHSKGINSRRGRAAAANIIPTSTGAAAAVGKVLPQLNGKLDGMAMRVPTVTGSVVDIVVELEKEATVESINKAMEAAANETLGYTEDPIVSSDVIGTKYGSVFDAQLTKMIDVDGKKMFKIITWYDNEMSYTSQLVRTLKHIATI
ncbi:glyceraldehyde-3-phosphate dehydrogenase (NAD+) [Dethiosulfatibacter aminovorans DSM 17477]|uniref:Glyceraldehyde-3-phosphate dehydrogenase n=1 Tax=Dethiosulfatibacter aminovorans DSM 17477 TaxID=1121476 RepID=A0A1M6FD70_9FIRM|nr:type I glyceraldehyde-3-phosphate dehydrogenase [Dethiosulfatibacter aminovorans]SHI95595.1 glyceraldehyde-3-phosphate dehydrogenase (NAD+) [Dethiosulfatibacter aminovorans DSM 17477]